MYDMMSDLNRKTHVHSASTHPSVQIEDAS